MSTLAGTYLHTAQVALLESRARLECSGDLPALTMAERKSLLKLLTLMDFDVAELRKLLA